MGGSTGSWPVLDCVDADKKHRCLLHNPFTGTTVPVPELDTIFGHVLETYLVNKVLRRSCPYDVVALMTSDRPKYPLVLARARKGEDHL